MECKFGVRLKMKDAILHSEKFEHDLYKAAPSDFELLKDKPYLVTQ